jgi:hypothetical protein
MHQEQRETLPLRKLLLAVEPTSLDARALEYTASLCQRLAASVAILWLGRDLTPAVHTCVQQMAKAQIECEIVLRTGSLLRETIQYAAQDRRITTVVVKASNITPDMLKSLCDHLPCPLVIMEKM